MNSMKKVKKNAWVIFQIALIMGILAIFTSNVQAAENLSFDNDVVTIHGDGLYGGASKSMQSGDTWTVTYKNNSEMERKISLDMICVTESSLSGGGAKAERPELISALDSNPFIKENSGFDYATKKTYEISSTFSLKSGESTTVSLAAKGTNVTYKASIVRVATYNVSKNSEKPISLTPGKEYLGVGETGYYYYSFKLEKKSAVKVSFSGNAAGGLNISDRPAPGSALVAEVKDGQIVELPEGTYYAVVWPTDKPNEEYKLKIDVETYNFGKIEIKWDNGKNKTKPNTKKNYTLTYTPGKNFGVSNSSYWDSVKLKEPIDFRSSESYEIKKDQTTFKGTVSKDHTLKAKELLIEAEIMYKPYGKSSETGEVFRFPLEVSTPAELYVDGGSEKSLVVKVSTGDYYGNRTVLQMKKKGKWVNVGSAAGFGTGGYGWEKITVKKLKPSTKYQFRAYCESGTGKNAMKVGYSKTVSAKTASKEVPKVKSIKVSDVKYRTFPRQWIEGYVDGLGRWIPGHYIAGGSMTYYKVTVTLAKKMKKFSKITVNGQRASGSGTKFTARLSEKGSKKGKKIYVSVCGWTKATLKAPKGEKVEGLQGPGKSKSITIQ